MKINWVFDAFVGLLFINNMLNKRSDVIKDGISLKNFITPSKTPSKDVTLSHSQKSAMLVIISANSNPEQGLRTVYNNAFTSC
jgi:hypothetical protein